MDTLRVGLIGTGYMGKCHALAWNAVASVFGDVPRPRLALLCDSHEPESRARELGFARATADWRVLVDHPEIDIVSITTPNQFHADMAIAALERGKHVWCEKPMATTLADAGRMREAARASGKLAVLGYNYIQNPVMRLMRQLIVDDAIGKVTHLRVEMDEDFMADAAAPFSLRNARESGYGAADDFMVHELSLIWSLVGPVTRVSGDMARPYADRAVPAGGRRAVETFDVANAFFRLENGASGVMIANRAAWGRKGRIAVQIFGAKGALVFDQERMNEVELFTADGPAATRGFRRILAAPAHPPYGKFVPAPGHSLGFNDLKVIECREILGRLRGEPALLIDFDTGYAIERAVHAIAASHESGAWIDLKIDPASN